MGSLNIASSGIFYTYNFNLTPPEKLSVSHCHDNYEILYISSGEGRYVVEGASTDITPPILLIIKPTEYHSVMLNGGRAYERHVINFSTSSLVEDSARLLTTSLFSGEDRKFCVFTGLGENIISIFDRLEGAASIPETERGAYMKMLLSELILLLSVSKSESVKRNEAELGARVIKYLNENIEKDVSLDKLARRFFVSKYYLCRAFKKHNGISVHGYVNQKRIMYAKSLIENGETASAAAYKVGFGDYSAFYRAYVKVLGKSPKAE